MITDREWHGLEVEAGIGYDALGPVYYARREGRGAMGQPPGTWGICRGPTGVVRNHKGESIPWALEVGNLTQDVGGVIRAKGPAPAERNPKGADAMHWKWDETWEMPV